MSDEYNQVPFEGLYKAFKNAESTILNRLNQIGDNEFLIGLQVGYDFVDSPNEPGIMPYTIEFGHLPPQETLSPAQTDENQVDEDTWNERFGKWFELDFMNELHDSLQKELQQSTNAPIRAGIIVNVHALSPSSAISFDTSENSIGSHQMLTASSKCNCDNGHKKSTTVNNITCCKSPC